jgi:2-C-methyl-D-erythritol 4-phosphate cytidylyltransferase
LNKRLAAIIVAGGTGSRMGTDVPKQFIKINGKEIILHTISTFEKCDFIDKIIVVCHRDYLDFCKSLFSDVKKDITVTEGGNTRQQSVFKGLKEAQDCEYVLVHDAVRCLIEEPHIKMLYNELLNGNSCTLAVRVKDTIKIADENNIVTNTPERSKLWQIQTPQAFLISELLSAHEYAVKTSFDGTDDCSVMEHYGKKITLVEGSYKNIKITTPSDIEIAKVFMKGSDDK